MYILGENRDDLILLASSHACSLLPKYQYYALDLSKNILLYDN